MLIKSVLCKHAALTRFPIPTENDFVLFLILLMLLQIGCIPVIKLTGFHYNPNLKGFSFSRDIGTIIGEENIVVFFLIRTHVRQSIGCYTCLHMCFYDLCKYGSYVHSYPFSTGYCMLPLFRSEVFPHWLVQMRRQCQTNDLPSYIC